MPDAKPISKDYLLTQLKSFDSVVLEKKYGPTEMTTAEYDLLTEEQRMDGTVRYLTDDEFPGTSSDGGWCPIGTVLAFAGMNAPAGYLLCDGTGYAVADYEALFAVIGNTYGGDGTTFNVPNLVDRFVQGSTVSGTVKEAGLPNLTGSFNTYNWNNGASTWGGGLFVGKTAGAEARIGYEGTGSAFCSYDFNASRANSVYGKSTTVQPPALTMRYIIKAK